MAAVLCTVQAMFFMGQQQYEECRCTHRIFYWGGMRI